MLVVGVGGPRLCGAWVQHVRNAAQGGGPMLSERTGITHVQCRAEFKRCSLLCRCVCGGGAEVKQCFLLYRCV